MSDSNDSFREPDKLDSKRDPEDRHVSLEHDLREKMLDKTLADSFPTSDPPSSIPDPSTEDSLMRSGKTSLFAGLLPGTWVALSLDKTEVFAIGNTRNEAEQNARSKGHQNMSLTEVPPESDASSQSTQAA